MCNTMQSHADMERVRQVSFHRNTRAGVKVLSEKDVST
jgi:hypothetical protein